MSAAITKEEAYSRLGSITREMHEALSVLGGNQLHDIVDEMPNARDRLAHVGKMTEEAANKVLNLVDAAKPECDDLAKRGVELGQSLSRMAAQEDLNIDRAAEQESALSAIMMTQDFQDLSGQVIKKVIDIISRTEIQLVQLLVDSTPRAEGKEEVEFTGETHQLQGPQNTATALAQNDVDDLLASMGF